ncbi:M28 family peptidase [Propionibacteriaceae bacterium Y2011]|uniref:M28 family peptidase n=1 Tax=Microlunatus sp. Y2014 TaxID=3418488 RepID=UPI003B46E4E0
MPMRRVLRRVGVLVALAVALTACQPGRPVPLPPDPTPGQTATSPTNSRTVPPTPGTVPPTPGTVPPTPGTVPPTEAMTVAGVRAHMAALQRVADANAGNRAAGTPGYEASVAYVREVLEAVGYEVAEQTFTFTYNEVRRQRVVREGGGSEIPVDVMEGSPATPAGGVTAPLVTPADPIGCAAADYTGVRGAIVLVERGSCPFAEKSRLAAEAGAAVVLIFDNEGGTRRLHGSLADADGVAPTAGLPQVEGRQLREALTRGPVRLTVELDVLREQRETSNVIAQWPGSPPDRRVVMAGAHLDSVRTGPGINDNGSGVALVLELATQLATLGEADGARFAFWGAEELGLLGSRHHVATMSDDDRRGVAAYLNFDMVASPNGAVGAYGDPGLVTLLDDFFVTRGERLGRVDLGRASDHAPFVEAGITAVGLFTGAGGTKTDDETERWGGTVGGPYDPCYHQVCDTLPGTDTDVANRQLDLISDAVVVTVLALLHRER